MKQTSNPVSREEHFRLLNAWQHTEEWKAGVNPDFQALVGAEWEITEETWWEFLEVLPPMGWGMENGAEVFYICEFLTGNITSKYTQRGGRYFHSRANYPPKRA